MLAASNCPLASCGCGRDVIILGCARDYAGIGGDAFALFYSAATREVTAMMGNGRSPAGLTMEVRPPAVPQTIIAPSLPLALLKLVVGALNPLGFHKNAGGETYQ